MELVDVTDLKSVEKYLVAVQVRPRAPFGALLQYQSLKQTTSSPINYYNEKFYASQYLSMFAQSLNCVNKCVLNYG